MELLESDDPKTQLLRKADSQRRAIDGEVKLISEKTEKIVKNALIVGGALAATYLIYRLLSDTGGKTKKKRKIKIVQRPANDEETEEVEVKESAITGAITKVGTVLASQAAVFLLSMAKEKLGEYLENRAANKDADAH
jgi:hypothetical protein